MPPSHRTPRASNLRAGSVLAVLALLGAACSSSPSTTTPAGPTPSQRLAAAFLAADVKAPQATIQAAGSTFVQPFVTKAFYAYSGLNSAVQIHYQGVGSGAGITAFQQGAVNFAASDVPMSAADLAKVPASTGPVLQIPDTLGGVAVCYDVPGIPTGLRLSGTVLAQIYAGTLTMWNAPAIAALNPKVTLPAHSIVPIVRADSSGTTYIFTDYLSAVSPLFAASVGVGKTVAWPAVAMPAPKNVGVAEAITATPYSIGYVELAYALQNNFATAAIQNRSGAFVRPTAAGVAADASRRTSVTPTSFSIVDEPGLSSYPIAGYSWAIVAKEQSDATTGKALVKVLDWLTHTGGGQDQAPALGYVVLPSSVQVADRTALLGVVGPTGQRLLAP